MFYGDTIQDTRQVFFVTWQKYKQNQILQPLEEQIIAVVLSHPEYQKFLESPEKYRDKEFLPELNETNPFLHMGLHLAVREQIATNRPAGITQIYNKLLHKYSDHLEVEHRFMEVLAEYLWQAQTGKIELNEENYREMLAKL